MAAKKKSPAKKAAPVKAKKAVKAKATKSAKPKAKSSKKTSTSSKALKKSSASLKAIAEKQTQAQIIEHIANAAGLEKKQIKAVFAATRDLVEAHLMPRGSGSVMLPELAIKIKRHERPASKARMGRNPFTGEEVKIAAKPKRKVVKAVVMKKLKEILV